MLEPSTVVKRSTQQVACNLNDEVALLHLDSALYFGLQGVGAQIWSGLEGPRSIADICNGVVREFDVTPEACRDDVIKFLASLQEAGLIEVVDPLVN
ncbi:MAG: PqqD family protein [bacterium]|nr:PqqD family protein [bacterium]